MRGSRHDGGTEAMTIALDAVNRGCNPVPIPRGEKSPNGVAWQKVKRTREKLSRYFSGDVNVGVQMGPMSSGLTDVDLDCRETLAIGALLRPVDFNSGVTRRKFFHNCPTFIAKIAFTKHVAWFKRNDGVREAPKENSA